MKKPITIADTVEFVRCALSGDPVPGEIRGPDEPEGEAHGFIRNALGLPAPVMPMGIRAKALIVLLEEEQHRRHLLKQQAN